MADHLETGRGFGQDQRALLQILDELQRAFGATGDGVGKEIDILQPDDPAAAEHRHRQLDQALRDPNSIHGFAAQIQANPLYRSTLVSDDGSTVAFALTTSAALTPARYLALDFDAQVRRAERPRPHHRHDECATQRTAVEQVEGVRVIGHGHGG